MATQHADDKHLFSTLAEDLKTPLTRIAYQAELAALETASATSIQFAAQQALKMLDAYLLGAKNLHNQLSLPLEPVNPAAVLADAMYELKDYAKRFACNVQLDAKHSHSFALSHRVAMQTAVTSLGKVFIEAQQTLGEPTKQVTLASYATKRGLAVGLFFKNATLVVDSQLLSRAKSHVGNAARPYVGFASGASAQLFIAEQLLELLHTKLRTAKRDGMQGLAFDLLPSTQLSLV